MSLTPPKTINLALQGGGSHGAFTWGVLDRLLEETQLKIEGISGASAGAMNAAVMLDGYSKGGAEAARQKLDQFWTRIGSMDSFGVPQRSIMDQMFGNWNTDASPVSVMADMMQHMFSPYQTNPFNYNPLRDAISEIVDMDALHACDSIQLFIAATNVETGKARIFERQEITVDVLMASACLPFAFQAVMIEGVPYWDGGYVGNPAIFPLIYKCQSPDVVVVQVNPLVRKGTPDSTIEIVNRINEICFNASFISEMRAIAFVQNLIDDDHLKDEESSHLKRMNMHVISAEEQMRMLGASSKATIAMDFLLYLKKLGRETADMWLKENWDKIGVKSSIDIKAMFL